jgi:glycosyltransferase involved in cell wall biosynthesis
LNELIAAVRSISANGVQCSLSLSGFADVENVSSISHQQLKKWGEHPGIEWLGPSDSMEKIYSAVDCVVLPSYREGMPRSLLEAGAMGLPVVATDVPGCRNIVKDGFNGLLCEARNTESLQTALLRMLMMTPAERAIMGENGRRLVAQKYDEKLVIEAALRAVESAIKGK